MRSSAAFSALASAARSRSKSSVNSRYRFSVLSSSGARRSCTPRITLLPCESSRRASPKNGPGGAAPRAGRQGRRRGGGRRPGPPAGGRRDGCRRTVGVLAELEGGGGGGGALRRVGLAFQGLARPVRGHRSRRRRRVCPGEQQGWRSVRLDAWVGLGPRRDAVRVWATASPCRESCLHAVVAGLAARWPHNSQSAIRADVTHSGTPLMTALP